MSITKQSASARLSFLRPIRPRRVRRPAPAAAPSEPARLVKKQASPAKKTRTPAPASPAVVPEHLRFHNMAVRPHPDGWALLVEEITEPAWVLSNKKKAVSAAKDAARDHAAVLRVHKRNGELQREISFA